jgi:hypothetical protein
MPTLLRIIHALRQAQTLRPAAPLTAAAADTRALLCMLLQAPSVRKATTALAWLACASAA